MPAEILAIGMATPVGLCAAQTAASIRTGIGRLVESHMPDVHGQMLVMGLADPGDGQTIAEFSGKVLIQGGPDDGYRG